MNPPKQGANYYQWHAKSMMEGDFALMAAFLRKEKCTQKIIARVSSVQFFKVTISKQLKHPALPRSRSRQLRIIGQGSNNGETLLPSHLLSCHKPSGRSEQCLACRLRISARLGWINWESYRTSVHRWCTRVTCRNSTSPGNRQPLIDSLSDLIAGGIYQDADNKESFCSLKFWQIIPHQFVLRWSMAASMKSTHYGGERNLHTEITKPLQLSV